MAVIDSLKKPFIVDTKNTWRCCCLGAVQVGLLMIAVVVVAVVASLKFYQIDFISRL